LKMKWHSKYTNQALTYWKNQQSISWGQHILHPANAL